MQQRAMIALALASDPDLIIADEPTTALDVTIQAQILDLLASLRDSRGISVLLITHDMGVVAEACDRVAVLYAGRVVEEGAVRDIFHRPSHPYTRGLLASLPAAIEPGGELSTIPGTVPSAEEELPACAFAARCPDAMPRCHATRPGWTELTRMHGVACFLHEAAAEEPT
jgi:peptide/nickel transport system ATP-binding protein